jgi:hypothetical protein
MHAGTPRCVPLTSRTLSAPAETAGASAGITTATGHEAGGICNRGFDAGKFMMHDPRNVGETELVLCFGRCGVAPVVVEGPDRHSDTCRANNLAK